MGENAKVDVVSMRVREGDKLTIEGVALDVLYTPGHTDDSYSFLMSDRVFTGDTLLIRGTGRTDFQNGSARDQYDSLFNKLLKLVPPDRRKTMRPRTGCSILPARSSRSPGRLSTCASKIARRALPGTRALLPTIFRMGLPPGRRGLIGVKSERTEIMTKLTAPISTYRGPRFVDGGVDTVVIGAGQAGLSVSYLLTKRGHRHVVLEKDEVGAYSQETNRGAPC
jgi:NAD(P)-binding Rossmann-like domain